MRINEKNLTLPADLEKICNKYSEYISSFFIFDIKRRVKKSTSISFAVIPSKDHIKKTRMKSFREPEFVELHKNYRDALKYRSEGKRIFKLSGTWDFRQPHFRKEIFADITCPSRPELPSVEVNIFDEGTNVRSNGAYVDEVNIIKVYINRNGFVYYFEEALEDLKDTMKHEMLHYFQSYGIKGATSERPYGLPKKRIQNKTPDYNTDDTERDHHNRDIEFMPNVQTYTFQLKQYLSKSFPKNKWMDEFKRIITGKAIAPEIRFISTSIHQMDKERWKLFVARLYHNLFS